MLHEGHRDRVLRRFSQTGFAGMEEHQKLELILFFSVPRQDTNELAHLLLNRYHTIARVLDAPAEQLKTFSHITDRTVQLFQMIKETSLLCEKEKKAAKAYLCTTDEVATYLQQQYAGIKDEKLSLLSMDNKGRFLSFDFVGDGDMASVGVSTRKITEVALQTRASVVVLCHNHPGGIAIPSPPDKLITRQLFELLNHLDIHLVDHIILTESDYISLRSCEECAFLFTGKSPV